MICKNLIYLTYTNACKNTITFKQMQLIQTVGLDLVDGISQSSGTASKWLVNIFKRPIYDQLYIGQCYKNLFQHAHLQ